MCDDKYFTSTQLVVLDHFGLLNGICAFKREFDSLRRMPLRRGMRNYLDKKSANFTIKLCWIYFSTKFNKKTRKVQEHVLHGMI